MDSIGDILAQGRDTKAQGSKVYGVVVGIVTNNKDPDGLGRVKVKFPWLGDSVESWWARVCVPMAGPKRGFSLIPEVDDEVLCAFEHGDVRFPYVVGSLFNGKDRLPEPLPNLDIEATYKEGGGAYGGPDGGGKIQQRYIKTRRGHIVYIDDSDDEPQITMVSSDGNLRFKMLEKDKQILIENANSDGEIKIHCPDGKVTIECKELDTHSTKDTTMKADQNFSQTADQGDFTQEASQKNFSTKSGMSSKHEAGTDMSVKAGTGATLQGGTTCDVKAPQVTCKGDGTAEFSSGGMTTVKGGVVQVN